MIPDCEARLKSGYEDLVSFLVRVSALGGTVGAMLTNGLQDSNGGAEELAGSETLQEAKKRVAELEEQFEDQ